MRIGIICAVQQELEPFLDIIQNREEIEKSMLTFHKGVVNKTESIALYCGVCKTNAAIATQILIDTFQCDVIINSGTAGGIAPFVKLLDTVISTECGYWDVAQGFIKKFQSWIDEDIWKSDSRLLKTAKDMVKKQNLSNIHFGRMITGEQFIEDENRTEIKETFSPLSVDMETASIAHTCFVNNVPFISVRTITDTEQQSGLSNFAENLVKASARSCKVVEQLIKEI